MCVETHSTQEPGDSKSADFFTYWVQNLPQTRTEMHNTAHKPTQIQIAIRSHKHKESNIAPESIKQVKTIVT